MTLPRALRVLASPTDRRGFVVLGLRTKGRPVSAVKGTGFDPAEGKALVTTLDLTNALAPVLVSVLEDCSAPMTFRSSDDGS
jgi:hypothetical protein